MACISASGTGCAERTWASAAGRTARLAALMSAPLLLAANDAPLPQVAAPDSAGEPSLTVTITGLRSARGLVRGCLTRNPAFFPNCDKDPQALKATVRASADTRLHFSIATSGDYALSILHDENSNARLDTMLGIPREGVGFSQNPRLRFSAPKFDAARFHIGASDISQQILLQYFL